MTYTYNLSGALIEEKYPSGRVVKNVLDNNGDLSIVQSKKNASHGYFGYAKNFTYTAAGAVSPMQLGNGKWESTVFNSRLQPTQIALRTMRNSKFLPVFIRCRLYPTALNSCLIFDSPLIDFSQKTVSGTAFRIFP